jgi:ATP-dependent DNA helicase 2 subunit 1
MKLVGFKNNARLKMYDQLRPSTFLYPDEATVSGSAKAFIALHDQLLKKGKYALCQVVRTASSEPRLVAVLPQEELIDEDTKEQVRTPPPSPPPLPASEIIKFDYELCSLILATSTLGNYLSLAKKHKIKIC